MNQHELLERFCILATRVGELSKFKKRLAAHDCFCGNNELAATLIARNMFQFDEQILLYIEKAVAEQIELEASIARFQEAEDLENGVILSAIEALDRSGAQAADEAAANKAQSREHDMDHEE